MYITTNIINAKVSMFVSMFAVHNHGDLAGIRHTLRVKNLPG